MCLRTNSPATFKSRDPKTFQVIFQSKYWKENTHVDFEVKQGFWWQVSHRFRVMHLISALFQQTQMMQDKNQNP